MPRDDPESPSTPSAPPATGPIGGQLAHVLRGLLIRFRVTSLVARYDSTAVMAAFSMINGLVSIALMSLVALVTGEPFIFPSLGPTAFLFFYTPLAPAASPRNTIIGHAIGAAAGWGSLAIFGLLGAAPATTTGVSAAHVGAAALSLGLTSALMVLARAPHPPAGATTLIVALGILHTLVQLAVLMAAVALLVLQAIVINRLAGLPFPLWSSRSERQRHQE